MSAQSETCAAVAEILRETFGGALGVTVELEDSCNPSAAMEKALGSWGVLVLVATSAHRRRPGTGASTAGDLAIDLVVVENPKRNRKSGTQGNTVTSVAEAAKDALHWREICGRRLVYVEMRREDAADDDYRMAVSFAAPLAIDKARADGWDFGGSAIEPEEAIEANIVSALAGAVPALDVIGALAPRDDGDAKLAASSRIEVYADVASQDLDWIGPGVPCTYAVRIVLRVDFADDRTGALFRGAGRAVRGALAALTGDGCAAMDGNGFSCDSFTLGPSQTSRENGEEGSGAMTKTYNATVRGRFNPTTETQEG